jgi:hypothetical protein
MQVNRTSEVAVTGGNQQAVIFGNPEVTEKKAFLSLDF